MPALRRHGAGAPDRHHVNARGRAGARLLAHSAVARCDDHRALYRRAEIYVRDGVDLASSTLSGWVGATAAAVRPASPGPPGRLGRASSTGRSPSPTTLATSLV
ncbi:transposase [Methylobacterium sp. J-026]|uniref:IS66 family transposase n=1 Tax=Methylobacterium sp. J-026 TaxID=2836624 RepID=UPI00391D5221